MRKLHLSAGGVLLLAALYFVLDVSEFAALLLAAAAHELGHLAAIALTGGRVVSITANVTGALITRSTPRSRRHELFCDAAGPVVGVVWAGLASGAGTAMNSDMLLISAGMGLALSVFNALPVLPLDGGRMFECLFGRKAAAMVSLVAASAVLLLGVVLAASDMGIALLAAGTVLMAGQARV